MLKLIEFARACLHKHDNFMSLYCNYTHIKWYLSFVRCTFFLKLSAAITVKTHLIADVRLNYFYKG